MRDSIGTTLQYWPLTMVAGQNSETLNFTGDNPSGAGTSFVATRHDNLKIWAKKVGDIDFVDISNDPYDLSALAEGPIDMQLYVEALIDVESFERDPVSVILASSSAAGWVS